MRTTNSQQLPNRLEWPNKKIYGERRLTCKPVQRRRKNVSSIQRLLHPEVTATLSFMSQCLLLFTLSNWCPRGVMVKSDELRNRSTRVRTPVALLRSLSGKYPWERYEPPYSPSSYG